MSVQNTEQTAQSMNNNYVICLKWGDKYSPDYVNRLHSMVQRNLTLPYEFICFTENATGIDNNIRIEPLPKLSTQGWWFKPYFLGNDLPIKDGQLLFFDLDVVIFNNIDKLFNYNQDKFCIIRDFNRSFRRTWDRMNSSVFKMPIGKYHWLWEDFKNNTKRFTNKNRGDQDMMYRHITDHVFWPDEWIQSYKWEMRNRSDLQLVNGKRNFKNTSDPIIHKDTSVAVFHGEPNPADCNDPWVKSHWG